MEKAIKMTTKEMIKVARYAPHKDCLEITLKEFRDGISMFMDTKTGYVLGIDLTEPLEAFNKLEEELASIKKEKK